VRLKVLIELIDANLKVCHHPFKKLRKIIIVHQIHKTPKRLILVTIVEERSRKESHILYIADVRSVVDKSDEDILQGLGELYLFVVSYNLFFHAVEALTYC